MDHQIRLFNNRVSRIEQAYATRIPNAYAITSDGLVVPRSRRRLRFRFPLRALIYGFACAVLLKGFLIYHLGQESYSARIDTLLAGSTYDQFAARVLMPDPASLWLAEKYALAVNFIRQP
ncbi:hypothetical protein [Rhodophyticola porphyridii]|uniref:Uncharacterized protein n=1 Tax=Rhodophyticola porphyridii TaxID=1852017 RepID=A0A3L9Y9F4_9RHOB|nr:hypothetical protein [Rhodophyticola porphyridii]RMA43908.1 hypothetical protein D9R08_03030 [Rhodophyticola porphyridii]